jgi:oxygen-dependent protoporphyrinogen oxidase
MEEKYGSLTRGMLAAHRQMRARAAAQKNGSAPGAKAAGPRTIFTTLRGGMQQLVDALEARLEPAWVRKSTAVGALERVDGAWKISSGGRAETFDAVILASPAWASSTLLGPVDVELSEQLGGIPYSSSITVNLVYDEAKMGTLPDGFGFLVPVVEGRAMLACTFVHRKFLGRTPPGKAVLRAFLGGAKNEALLDETDDVLIATVRRELSEILGTKIAGPHVEPERTQVSRWRRAMAQYAVGHQDRMKRIAARVDSLPGLRLAGNAYDGIGIPDCIRTGRKAAKEILDG